MTETMMVSQELNLAADHIEQYGHKKFGLGEFGQPTCALGALFAATGTSIWSFTRGSIALHRYLGGDLISTWNNAPGRTGSEVVEALRACAVIEESCEHEAARESVPV